MDQTNQMAGLEMLLRDMYEALTELNLVLDTEHQALKDTDMEKLSQAAVDKERLSHKIEQQEQSRSQFLGRFQAASDNAAMIEFIERYGADSTESLLSLWQMVEELAVNCDAQNRVNGIVIDNTKRQTQAALAILRGQFGVEDNLYDADGSSVAQKNNSTLARA